MAQPIIQLHSLDGKKALEIIRRSDFAHPGDQEAIDLVFKHLPKDPSQRVLDIGSGLGATADYIRRQGWGKVTGIDVNRPFVIHANETYQRCDFVHGDIVDAPLVLKPGFDLLVSFASFYVLPDQAAALQALSQVASPTSKLAMIDYVDRGGYQGNPILENGKPLLPNPLHLDQIERLLAGNGWRLYTIEPLHTHFADWFDQYIEQFQAAEEKIRDATREGFYEHMLDLCIQRRDAIRDNRLGGAIIHAVHGKA